MKKVGFEPKQVIVAMMKEMNQHWWVWDKKKRV